MLLKTKLTNALKKNPQNNYTYLLKNISINGVKRGCSGFVVNENNGLVVYVDTEPMVGTNLVMYRYARDTKDYTGCVNRFCKQDSLVENIQKCLNVDRRKAIIR